MAWIESHQELGNHPKTRKLARRLHIHQMQAVGHLHALWWWVLDYADNGDLSRFDVEDIALGAHWDGDADPFVKALLHSGFLDDDMWVHDWDMYGGKLADQRRRDRERKRAARDVQRTSRGRDAEIRGAADVDNTTQHNQLRASAPSVQAYDEAFESWWTAYPRKVAKAEAAKAWRDALKRATTEQLTEGLQRWLPAWNGRPVDKIPHAATWLRGQRWADDLSSEHAVVGGRPEEREW